MSNISELGDYSQKLGSKWLAGAMQQRGFKEIALSVLVFTSMLIPVFAVNIKRNIQYAAVQDSYLKDDYAQRLSEIWKILWSLPERLEASDAGIAKILETRVLSQNILQTYFSNSIARSKASFSVYLNSERKIVQGASQYQKPGKDTYELSLLPEAYRGLVDDKFVAGTNSADDLRETQEKLFRGKRSFPSLVHPLKYVNFATGHVRKQCQLSHFDFLRQNKLVKGFAVLDLHSLRCLGIESQLGISPNKEMQGGLVGISVAPIIKNSRVAGYVVSGYLLNNLYQLGDYFLATQSAFNMSIFCRQHVVMTLMADKESKRTLERRLDRDVVSPVMKDGWIAEKDITISSENYYEVYLPILDYQNRPVGVVSVARGSVLRNYLQQFSTISWIEVCVSVIGIWILGTPLRKMLQGQYKQIEEKNQSLLQSNQQKEIVIQNLDEGILGLDVSGRVIFSNSYAQNLLQYPQLEGLHFGSFMIDEGVTNTKTKMYNSTEQTPSSPLERFTTEFVKAYDGRVMCEYSIGSSTDDKTGLAYLLIFRDITERLEAEEQRQATTAMKERQRISREIHDGLASGITGLKFQLEAAIRLVPLNLEKGMKYLKKAFGISIECLIEVDQPIFDNRTDLDQLTNLVEGLQRVIDMFSSDQLHAEFQVLGEPVFLPHSLGHCLLQVFREALKNSARHANATHVTCRISFEGDELTVLVEDNGVGFLVADTMRKKPNSGLASMHQRVNEVGGTLQILSSHDKGTTITVSVNLPEGIKV